MSTTTLNELSKKQVVSLCDGRILGHVGDLVFDLCDGRICAIVVPDCSVRFWKRGGEEVIPWCRIQRIGEDAILVDTDGLAAGAERKGKNPRE